MIMIKQKKGMHFLYIKKYFKNKYKKVFLENGKIYDLFIGPRNI